MTVFKSGFSDLLERFVAYRNAAGSWGRSYAANLKCFDAFCSEMYPGQQLSQEMVDIWCAKRDTETSSSCRSRIFVVHSFIRYLNERGLTDIKGPTLPRYHTIPYVPHAFTHEELSRFFDECDHLTVKTKNCFESALKKITCPVIFRLLYSSGIRTTEARFLKRTDVDLTHGILNIQKSKGADQHYVALHPTMTELLKRYDLTVNKLLPDRTYFFESATRGHYSTQWLTGCFNELWRRANGRETKVTAYALRHNYAVTNINRWEIDSFEFNDKLHFLSKSMGHSKIRSTLYYYHIVPRLADTLIDLTERGFNDIVPDVEVLYEE